MSVSQINHKRFFGFDIPYLISEWKAMLNPATVMPDLFAGITVALVALPLNLALAIAAGVEPGVGIITGIVAGIISAFFGGQRYAVTGPAAAMAVVLIEIAQTYGIAAIWLVGLVAGILQMVSGFFRLGKVISYIPMPVIVGFANAIGILVLFNALDDFFGLPTKSIAHAASQAPFAGHPVIPEFIRDMTNLIWRIIMHGEGNLIAVLVGTIVIVIAAVLPKIAKAIPGQLIAIVVASLFAYFMHFDLPKIIDISRIPTSIPLPTIPSLPWEQFGVLFASAVTVFMLGSIESLLSASVADGMTMSKRHHSDQELIGQGLANVIVPFFGGIPVTGVIARTAVNIRAGAKTRLSAIVHSLVLMALAFIFAKLAEQIPLAALSGILILTGYRLFEWEATKQIWKASRTEGYVVLLTTIASVAVDLTAGVIIGLFLTCGLFIKQMSSVKILPTDETNDRRSTARQPIPSCKFVRTFLIDGPLFFGAAERFAETILYTQDVKVVILHMREVDVLDLTGAETILSIHTQLSRNGIRLVLAELPLQPFDLLKRHGAVEKIGADNFFKDYQEALLTINTNMLQTTCAGCAKGLDLPPCPTTESKDLKATAKLSTSLRISGQKDCNLRNAILLNANNVVQKFETFIGRHKELTKTAEYRIATQLARLYPIKSQEDIPTCLLNTPVEELIKCQNFALVDTQTDTPNLLIGMCIDYRKQLNLPRNCAYIIRSAGANMRDYEFSIALALSSGIKHMALITHNQCLMSIPEARREVFINNLAQNHGWTEEQAATFFDKNATSRAIDDAIDFALKEAIRLRILYRGLTIVPMVYLVENDKLYLIREWLEEQPNDNPQNNSTEKKEKVTL
jgi:SulP family sulfate permease